MNAGRALAFVIPFCLVAPPALAEEPPAEKKGAASRDASASAAPAQGLVVFIDPVTGKIRQPEPAEIGALTARPPGAAPAAPAAEAPLTRKTGPGGAVGIALDARFESFMVVTKGPDGKLGMSCVTGGRAAKEAVAAGAGTEGKKDGKEAPRVP